MLLSACSPKAPLPSPEPTQEDMAAGIILKGADEAKNIRIEDVEKVELYDLEGNVKDTDLDKTEIVNAFNASMIDDTSYIEMISGSILVISFKDDKRLTITSYGDDTRIVASTETQTYHLISPELAKILLS